MVKKTTTKKKYVPSTKEKYMCARHKKFFTEELLNWKKDIIKANNLGNLLNSSDELRIFPKLLVLIISFFHLSNSSVKNFLCFAHIYFSFIEGVYLFFVMVFFGIY